MHYCMGEFQSLRLWHGKHVEPKCPVCGMTNKKGCCEDRHVVIKVEKKHEAPVVPDFLRKADPQCQHFSVVYQLAGTDRVQQLISSHPPPDNSSGIALFIRYCVYRI